MNWCFALVKVLVHIMSEINKYNLFLGKATPPNYKVFNKKRVHS